MNDFEEIISENKEWVNSIWIKLDKKLSRVAIILISFSRFTFFHFRLGADMFHMSKYIFGLKNIMRKALTLVLIKAA